MGFKTLRNWKQRESRLTSGSRGGIITNGARIRFMVISKQLFKMILNKWTQRIGSLCITQNKQYNWNPSKDINKWSRPTHIKDVMGLLTDHYRPEKNSCTKWTNDVQRRWRTTESPIFVLNQPSMEITSNFKNLNNSFIKFL